MLFLENVLAELTRLFCGFTRRKWRITRLIVEFTRQNGHFTRLFYEFTRLTIQTGKTKTPQYQGLWCDKILSLSLLGPVFLMVSFF